MATHAALTLALLLALSTPSAFARAIRSSDETRPRTLAYTLEPVFVEGGLRFRITVDLDGDPSGTTRIETPSSWASARDLEKGIVGLAVMTKGAKLEETPEPKFKIVTHVPGRTISLRYELVQIAAGPPPAGRDGGYVPYLQPQYFHWIGHGAFVRPAWDESTRVAVSLHWKNLPKEWTTSNSFGSNERKQRFVTSLGALGHAIYTGGDFRVAERKVDGKSVVVAIRGTDWKFSDTDFISLVEKVVGVERRFWRDHDTPYYLVTLLPTV